MDYSTFKVPVPPIASKRVAGVMPTSQAPQVAQTYAQGQNPGLLGAIGNFANSPAGQSAIQAGGALLSGIQDGKQADANRQQNANQNAASIYQRQDEQDQLDQRTRASGVLDANPLGAANQFAAKQALMRDILPQLRNTSFQVNDPAIQAAIPQMSGGLRLPEGGLSADALQPFSKEATADAIATRQMNLAALDPSMARSTELGTLGLDADGAVQGRVNAYQQSTFDRMEQEQAEKRAAIQRAIDNDIAGEKQQKEKKKSGGILGALKKIGKVAAFAAPIVAAPFTGGASLAAIGALSGAAGGLLDGGGLKGAIMGGALGGIPMGGGLAKGAAAPALGAGLKQAAKSAVKNPALLASIAQGVK